MQAKTESHSEDLLGAFFSRVPIDLCRRHGICLADSLEPQKCEDGKSSLRPDYQLLYSDRTPAFVLDNIGRFIGVQVERRKVEYPLVIEAIHRGYENHQRKELEESTKRSTDSSVQNVMLSPNDIENDLLQSKGDAPIVALVNRILFDAVLQQASDIHFQPFEASMMVRFRIDGVLFDYEAIDKTTQEEVLARIKVAGRMDIAEKRLPQDGRATIHVGSRVIDLRIASMPSSHGERIVVRILDKSARMHRLRELGMDRQALELFRKAIHVEHGLILVTGPTGSGKSTTLYSALGELDTRERNAVTLEDPIEYQLSGVSQTQINLKKGMTFASGLRSVLRQDPDIIMVGEIRDAETAVMAVQAALTGHLVFSTLHTNDASSAITRMLDLGIEPYLLASSLVAVLAQRLVRKLCDDCKVPQALSENGTYFEAVGCKLCRGSGYRGRLGVYELLVVDDSIQSLITKHSHSSEIRDYAVKQGMLLLEHSCQEKLREGLTSLGEVQRVTARLSQ